MPNFSRALADGLAKDSLPPPRPSGSDAEESRVYIDASESMAGFGNAGNQSLYAGFINDLADALPSCQFYKYGQSKDNSSLWNPIPPNIELFTASFYDRIYNPDDQLIEFLAKEDRPVLSVLITDGVYSQSGGNTPPAVVTAIQKWMEKGGYLGIFILKSRYEYKKFWSESHRGWLPGFKGVVEARPFYAFVFSPTEKGIEDLHRKLSRSGHKTQAIVFSDDAIDCDVTLQEGKTGAYSSERPPSKPFYWQMFNTDFFDGKETQQIDYKIHYKFLPSYPVTSIHFDVATDYYPWEKSEFKKSESGPPRGFKIQLKNVNQDEEAETIPDTNGEYEYQLSPLFIKDPDSDYSFYQFKLKPSIVSLREDIRDLSTNNDELLEDTGKTYRFYQLISSLTEIHFKLRLASKISPMLFITLTNH